MKKIILITLIFVNLQQAKGSDSNYISKERIDAIFREIKVRNITEITITTKDSPQNLPLRQYTAYLKPDTKIMACYRTNDVIKCKLAIDLLSPEPKYSYLDPVRSRVLYSLLHIVYSKTQNK